MAKSIEDLRHKYCAELKKLSDIRSGWEVLELLMELKLHGPILASYEMFQRQRTTRVRVEAFVDQLNEEAKGDASVQFEVSDGFNLHRHPLGVGHIRIILRQGADPEIARRVRSYAYLYGFGVIEESKPKVLTKEVKPKVGRKSSVRRSSR